MTTLWSFIMAHQTTAALVAFWLFSNVVTALPSPNNDSNGFYKWAFAFGHGLAGSLARVFPSARVFNDPTQGSATYFAKDGAAAGTPPAPAPVPKP